MYQPKLSPILNFLSGSILRCRTSDSMRQVIESKLHKPSVRRFAAQFGQSQPLLTFLPRESGELLDGFRWSHLFVYRSKALLYSRIPQHFITCLEQGIHDFFWSAFRRENAPPIRNVVARQSQLRHGPILSNKRRSDERRVGKECVSTCRSRGSQYH